MLGGVRLLGASALSLVRDDAEKPIDFGRR